MIHRTIHKRRAVLGPLLAVIALLALSQPVASQNLVVSSGSAFEGSGTIEVEGDINTVNAGAAVSIPGTVKLNGTAQEIGKSGGQAITFAALQALGDGSKTMTTNVTVTDALTVNITGSSEFLDVVAQTLTLSGSSTLTNGSLDVSDGSSTVVYNKSTGSQTVLGLTYAGAVTLSGGGAKSLSASASVAGAFSHSGGGLTVDQDLTVSSATPSFGTITDVATGKTLTLSGTGAKSISTVTANAGTIANTGSSGLLTIGTLTASSGTISTGAGGATFTNAATNSGTITGGAGLVTFSNTLGHGTETITSGSGGMQFDSTVTFASGTITSGTGLLNFNRDVANTSAAVLSLTGSATAQFGGAVAATGLSFSAGSTVTYDGSSAGQTIADVNYGNLSLSSGTKSWTMSLFRNISGNLTLGSGAATTVSGAKNLNVGGNVSLSANLTKSDSALVFNSASSAVSGFGSEIVGAVTRAHTFIANNSYTLNNAKMIVTPTNVTNLTSVTLKSLPGTNPTTGYNAGNSVNRKYLPTFAGTDFAATIQLSYLSSEYTGTRSAKLKHFAGSIAKDNKLSGTYTRDTSDGFSYVALTGYTNATVPSEIALDDRFNVITSIAAANWDVTSTWDEGVVPTANDDVVIAALSPVTVPNSYDASALSATVNSGATLTVGGGASGSLSVGVGGLVNNSGSSVTGLDVKTAATVTITGASLTNNGKIANAGTIKVKR